MGGKRSRMEDRGWRIATEIDPLSSIFYPLSSILYPCTAYTHGVLFIAVILGILIGDIAWWRWADRCAQKLPRPRVWRSVVAGFVSLELTYILFFVVAPIAA